MGWADAAIQRLGDGETAEVCPRGTSMQPLVRDRDLVTLAGYADDELPQRGDVVLVRVRGRVYLHLIRAVQHADDRYLIGNNRGGTNGWVGRHAIYGHAIRIEGG